MYQAASSSAANRDVPRPDISFASDTTVNIPQCALEAPDLLTQRHQLL
jgi:hypothetical protein